MNCPLAPIGRRLFVSILGLGAFGMSLDVEAQPAGKVWRIGVLLVSYPERSQSLLREGLRALGYEEGKNILVEYRSAASPDTARLADLAAELVRLKVDVIVAQFTPAAQAARGASADIPIVMAPVGDPVGTGLVASLARPGGNVTGVSGVAAELARKNVQLIREVMPSARRVVALCNATDPFAKPFLEQIQLGAQTIGVAIQPIMIGPGMELDTAFSRMSKDHIDAVLVQGSLPTKRAAELALQHRLLAVSVVRGFVVDGGLMSYSDDTADTFRRAAVFVDKILRGAKPADLPVEQPTKFDLVINMRTAKALGVTIPQSLLLRADEVIR